jgi:hypothetical protein
MFFSSKKLSNFPPMYVRAKTTRIISAINLAFFSSELDLQCLCMFASNNCSQTATLWKSSYKFSFIFVDKPRRKCLERRHITLQVNSPGYLPSARISVYNKINNYNSNYERIETFVSSGPCPSPSPLAVSLRKTFSSSMEV